MFLLRSKTLWFNVLYVAAYALDGLAQTDLFKSNPDLVVLANAIGNMILRVVTTKPLSQK